MSVADYIGTLFAFVSGVLQASTTHGAGGAAAATDGSAADTDAPGSESHTVAHFCVAFMAAVGAFHSDGVLGDH